MVPNPYAGDVLEHPAMTRTDVPKHRVVYAIAGPLEADIAHVFARRARMDLLAAADTRRDVWIVLDCAACPSISPAALRSIEGTGRLVNGQPRAGMEFTNVGAELLETLKALHYDRTFVIR